MNSLLEYALVMLLTSMASPPEELVAELRKCKAIRDSHVRLQCFDEVASSLEQRPEQAVVVEKVADPAPPGGEAAAKTEAEPAEPTPAAGEPSVEMETNPVEPAPPAGKWILSTETNPADGTTTAWARLPAVGVESGRPVDLILRCQSRETSVSIDWGEYLRRDSPSVTTRIDSFPQVTSEWTRAPDKRVASYEPAGPKRLREEGIRKFVLQLRAADKLAARLVQSGGGSITAVFELAGVREALAPVRQACGW